MKLLFAALNLIDPTKDNLPNVTNTSGDLQKALTLVFVITGAISLMMLVIAGFRYTVSAGDPNQVATARRIIIYTTIGLIVSAMAATIVNVVLGQT